MQNTQEERSEESADILFNKVTDSARKSFDDRRRDSFSLLRSANWYDTSVNLLKKLKKYMNTQNGSLRHRGFSHNNNNERSPSLW